jgi:hypothetical protein
VQLSATSRQPKPTPLIQITLLLSYAMILWLGAITASPAQDISNIKSALAAKQCPAAEYSHLHYDSRGCGFSGQKACDQQYNAPGQAWQDCYHRLHLCQEQIDADNKVIDESNRVYAACQPKHSSSNPPNVSGSSDLASRLAAQQAKNSGTADVRRQQDQQFADTVQSTQRRYQQQKAIDDLAECDSRHEQDFATCNGNTGQYYKENRFPSDWVNMEGIACRNTANVRLNLCKALAKGDPDSQADGLRELLQRTEMTHRSINENISSYMPQSTPSDDSDSDYVYQAPVQSYQGRTQQAQPAPSRQAQPYTGTPNRGCVGDSTVCSGGGGIAPRPYVPPPQPRFVGPSGAVR